MAGPSELSLARARWNAARWPVDGGHYESWFQRANHPTRALGFWIRYTIFAPAGAPERAQGELWAIWFDGERDRIVAAKSEHAIAGCRFDRGRLDVSIGGATLDDAGLHGRCDGAGHQLAWSLRYAGEQSPLLLLPERLYRGGFPKAKAVVPSPLCRFDGTIDVDGEAMAIDGWLGTQNHNWGARHTDRYAWGQVAGFDGRDDACLECISSKLRLGPVMTPWLTVAVLRLGDETLCFNTLQRAPLGRARIDGLHWRFDTGNGRERLRMTMTGRPEAFVGLRYRNPPGGEKICLNSKIARCEAELLRPGAPPLVLRSEHRAAFELLDSDVAGIPVVA